jgi:hypothetical protein
LIPVATQKEEQIQHEEHADDELDGVLAGIDCMSCKKLAASQHGGRKPLVHIAKVRKSTRMRTVITTPAKH